MWGQQYALCDPYQQNGYGLQNQNSLYQQNDFQSQLSNKLLQKNGSMRSGLNSEQNGSDINSPLSGIYNNIHNIGSNKYLDEYAQRKYIKDIQNNGFPQQFGMKKQTNCAIDPSLMKLQQTGWGGQSLQMGNNCKNNYNLGKSSSRYNGSRSTTSSYQLDENSSSNNSFLFSNGVTPKSSVRNGVKTSDDQMSESLMQELIYRFQRKEQNGKVQEITERFVQLASSRTVSILLRTLHKQGLTGQALKLFDWLRNFKDDKSPEYALCDVFTYTAAISLCVNQLQQDKAIKLSNEMNQRGIQKNVYTYTALMNVCIKSGQFQVALDVYKEMADNKCPLNVVTYNTLIDVYGKLGRYEEALKIFDNMSQEGVEPVTRTYNTLMIACNTSNNWQETLKVYNKMLQLDHAPNTTTYNALITAYSKAGRLEKVLEIYQDMVSKGCERSVITYSSLINACEKAGQWELALYVFNEMRCLGCPPNLITFNSIISACSQGALCQKAEELLEQMKKEGCKPDVVTYTSLIRTYEKAGNYCGAFEKFQEMQRAGVRPDAIAYIAIIEALYESGVSVCQVHSANLYRKAIQQRNLVGPLTNIGDTLKLVMSTSSAPVAMLNFFCSLADLRDKLLQGQSPEKVIGAQSFAIMVSKVKGKEYGENVLKECLNSIFKYSKCPLKLDSKAQNNKLFSSNGRGPFQNGNANNVGLNNNATEIWECDAEEFCKWLLEQGTMFQLFNEQNIEQSNLNIQQEYGNVVECQNVMDAILNFEVSHYLNMQTMGSLYIEKRQSLLERAYQLFGQTGLAEEEVIHDGMLLFDRAMSSVEFDLDQQLFELAIITSIFIALKLSLKKVPELNDVARIAGFPPIAIEQMEQSICQALNNDTSTVCALRNLKVLLERLGTNYSDNDEAAVNYGGDYAHQTIAKSQKDSNFLNYRPSILASVALYMERLNKGIFPYWPSSLKQMTKYSHIKTPEFTSALTNIRNWQYSN